MHLAQLVLQEGSICSLGPALGATSHMLQAVYGAIASIYSSHTTGRVATKAMMGALLCVKN